MGDDLNQPPAGNLDLTEFVWKKAAALHRIHDSDFLAGQFNDNGKGDARFSPIQNAKGGWIPTLYAGDTFDCAGMEAPFHDVPYERVFKSVGAENLGRLVYSVLEPARHLRLADLTGIALHKLGITRAHLIDTDRDQYPATREWAKAIHDRGDRGLQGLCWTSRPADPHRALMLFGDRVKAGTLVQVGESRSLLRDSAVRDQLFELAERIGVKIVPGK